MAADLDQADLNGSLASPVLKSMTFLNEIAQRYPDAISFAAGRPTEELFDTELIHDYLRLFEKHLRLRHSGDLVRARRTLLQYGPTRGIIADLIARYLVVDEGIHVDEESIVVTTGCQEALYLTMRALRSGPQDRLLAVSPCYPGLSGAAELAGMPVLPVRETANGIDLDDLVRVAQETRRQGLRPRACYLVPDFANPSGSTLPKADRRRLLEIAARYDLLILEDNPYGIFRDRPTMPTLKALDRERRVIYLGTFAKSGIPGARVGFAVADQIVADDVQSRLAAQLAQLKSMVTVNTSPIAQAVIGGKLLAHECSLRAANSVETILYQRNRESLLDGLAEHFPPGAPHGVSWQAPDGGFFIVLDLPFLAGDGELERCARDFGVLWAPLHHFYGDGRARTQIRLSFSAVSPLEIKDGLERLAEFVRAESEAPHIDGADGRSLREAI